MFWRRTLKDVWSALWKGTGCAILAFIFISHLIFLSGLPVDPDITIVATLSQVGILLILITNAVVWLTGAGIAFGWLLSIPLYEIPKFYYQAYKQRKVVMKNFIRSLRYHNACQEALVWLKHQRSPQEAWDKCKQPDWMYWLLLHSSIANPTSCGVDRITLTLDLATWSDLYGYLDLRGNVRPEIKFYGAKYRSVCRNETANAIRKTYRAIPYRAY